MEKVVELLRNRNSLLKEFSSLNVVGIKKIGSGNYDFVSDFYSRRENILKMISHIEFLLERRLALFRKLPVNNVALKREIEVELKERDRVVTKILEQDLEVISLIDKAKTNLIHELKDVAQNRKAMKAYNSF